MILYVWILLYCLKKCGFENLNNPLFEKPKTDRNRNTPKPIDFQPFQLVSVENFTNQNIRFQLAIPIQTDQNRTEHTPSVNRGYSSTPFYCNSSQFGFLLNNITVFLLKKKKKKTKNYIKVFGLLNYTPIIIQECNIHIIDL